MAVMTLIDFWIIWMFPQALMETSAAESTGGHGYGRLHFEAVLHFVRITDDDATTSCTETEWVGAPTRVTVTEARGTDTANHPLVTETSETRHQLGS